METVRKGEITACPRIVMPNYNQRPALIMGRSLFPQDAVARIYKPSRSAMTSGKGGTKGWRLVFERRSAPFIEPLMGYTGGTDTLVQVELRFPTLESATRYAERQGLTYVIQAADETESSCSNRTRRFGKPPVYISRECADTREKFLKPVALSSRRSARRCLERMTKSISPR